MSFLKYFCRFNFIKRLQLKLKNSRKILLCKFEIVIFYYQLYMKSSTNDSRDYTEEHFQLIR